MEREAKRRKRQSEAEEMKEIWNGRTGEKNVDSRRGESWKQWRIGNEWVGRERKEEKTNGTGRRALRWRKDVWGTHLQGQVVNSFDQGCVCIG